MTSMLTSQILEYQAELVRLPFWSEEVEYGTACRCWRHFDEHRVCFFRRCLASVRPFLRSLPPSQFDNCQHRKPYQ